MIKYMPYAGIGSRQTPLDILELMATISETLNELGFTLRSGGADGADTAFESKAGNKKEIFIPWNGFNGRNDWKLGNYVGWPDSQIRARADHIAEQFHPAWNNCSPGAKKMHMRNVAQVLGWHLNKPSLFVVCWTPDGLGGGGTGQAIRIAKSCGIPVYDLGGDTDAVLESLSKHVLDLTA